MKEGKLYPLFTYVCNVQAHLCYSICFSLFFFFCFISGESNNIKTNFRSISLQLAWTTIFYIFPCLFFFFFLLLYINFYWTKQHMVSELLFNLAAQLTTYYFILASFSCSLLFSFFSTNSFTADQLLLIPSHLKLVFYGISLDVNK